MFEKKGFLFSFAILCLTVAVSLGGCSQEETAGEDQNFNLVLVVSDALRRDVIGCYGGEARTPNIDRLAKRGVLFENAYSTSPWTPPAAVSIFTGNYATSYPYNDFEKTIQIHVPDDEVLLAEVLRERGYDTAIKNGNVQAGLQNCLQGLKVLPDDLMITEDAFKSIQQITGAQLRDPAGYVNSFNTLNHLLGIPEAANFFVIQWILDPHEPYTPVRTFAEAIAVDQSKLTQPAKLYSTRNKIEGALNEADIEYLKARYIAEVESVDERIGYILKMIQHKNVLETTYFVFTSDHGELFGEHDLFGHGINYFEELLRVPLIISGPGVPEGKKIKATVSLVDLMPTLKDMLGVEYADNMQGQSFKGLMFKDSRERGPLYFDDVREHPRVDALLENGFKLVARGDGTCELYDLSRDAPELNDIAPDHESTVQEMLAKLMAKREANQQRRAVNLTRLDSDKSEFSDEEKEELQKKLKALGYIQ